MQPQQTQEPESPCEIEIYEHFEAGGMTFKKKIASTPIEPKTPPSSPETTPSQDPHLTPTTSPRRLLGNQAGKTLTVPQRKRSHSAPITAKPERLASAAAAATICKKHNEESQKKSAK